MLDVEEICLSRQIAKSLLDDGGLAVLLLHNFVIEADALRDQDELLLVGGEGGGRQRDDQHDQRGNKGSHGWRMIPATGRKVDIRLHSSLMPRIVDHAVVCQRMAAGGF